MIPPNHDRHHGRDPQPFIILPEIAQLAILFGHGHRGKVVHIPDGLKVAAEEEEVCFCVCAQVGLKDGAVDRVEGAVGAALDRDLGGQGSALLSGRGGREAGSHAWWGDVLE